MMLYIWATLSGLLIGFAVCAGAARMFKAPEVQGMGAFRTLGEMNACNGDSISHFSVGLGFFLSSAAAAAGTGALTQDIHHRVLPNWAATAVTLKNKSKKMELVASPSRMGIAGAIIGAIIIPLIILINKSIPEDVSAIAKGILSPAATWLFKYVMPAIFLLAALGAGKWQGVYAVLFGAASQFISGNALPGIVLGILVGSIAAQLGHKNNKTIAIIAFVSLMFILIFYFRNMDPNTYMLKPNVWEKFKAFKVVK